MGVADAASALRALIDDPEDTSQVFRIIQALSGHTGARITRRMRESTTGRGLLTEQPDLLAKLQDRDGLRALPEDSLGRHYLGFCDVEGISAEGLIDASERGYAEADEPEGDEAYVASRMRDTHDLWHVVTGYHGDLIGEVALLAFTFAQTFNRGVALIVMTGLLKTPDWETRKVMIDGFRRGRRATWLPAVAWEELLHLPLDRVRGRLGVGLPPVYEPVRTSDL